MLRLIFFMIMPVNHIYYFVVCMNSLTFHNQTSKNSLQNAIGRTIQMF